MCIQVNSVCCVVDKNKQTKKKEKKEEVDVPPTLLERQ